MTEEEGKKKKREREKFLRLDLLKSSRRRLRPRFIPTFGVTNIPAKAEADVPPDNNKENVAFDRRNPRWQADGRRPTLEKKEAGARGGFSAARALEPSEPQSQRRGRKSGKQNRSGFLVRIPA